MRVRLFQSGLLLAIGLISTSLASADDVFGAGRKMEGASRYTPSGSGFDSARNAQGPVSPFSPSKLQNYSQDEATPPSVMKRSGSANVQEIYPTADTSATTAPVAAAPNNTNPSMPVVGGGLKSLQQRFSTMRKQTTAKPNAGSWTPTGGGMPSTNPTANSMVEQPAAASGRTTMLDATGGPSAGGPVPPTMPDIRTAQRQSFAPVNSAVPPATTAVQNGSSISLPTGFRTASPVTQAQESTTVGGPLTSSRRMPTGQVSALPREDQSSDSATSEKYPHPENNAPSTCIAGGLPTPAVTADSTPPVHAAVASRGANVLFTRQSPILGVETVGPRSITIGKEATYTVAIANSGDAAAQEVKVSVRIPSWTDVVGATATSGTAQAATDTASEPLTWIIPRLEANAKEQLSLRLVPRESRPFDLAVQWTFSPVVSQAMVEVKEPKLAMSVAGPEEILYGETKVYKLSLANPGTGDAENVVLFLSPIDGSVGTPTRHEIGNIAAGQNKLVEMELTARQAGKLTIKGSALADGNLKTEARQEILVRRAALKVVTTGPELSFAGTVADYNIAVDNPGNAAAESIQVAAMLPAGAKYVSSNGGQYVAEQNKVVWTVSSLRQGGEQDFNVKCVLNTPGANRLQVVALAASDLSDTTAINTNVEALADLKLEVSDPTGPVPVGQEVAYELHIRNRGTKAAENVAVAGFFSGGIEPLLAQGAQYELGSGQIVFKPLVSIAPGAEVVLKIKAKAELAGNHIFRAEVNCAAVGMKLASEETTLFYGELANRSARMATKPGSPLGPATLPTPAGNSSGSSIVR